MKKSDKSIIILSIAIIVIVIAMGLLFIHNGFENNFIHTLPSNDDHDGAYASLINLYQTRVEVVNWGIACIGALLTFMAFYVQYQYNSVQKEDLAKERFENKLFHLLDVYREICSQTSLNGVGVGKIVFHYMFYEYKAIYNLIVKNKNIINEIREPENHDCLNYVAFSYFLNGVTASSLKTAISDKVITEVGDKMIREELLRRQELSENYDPALSDPKQDGVTYIMDYRHKRIKYFDGHRFRLGPYVKYVSLIVDFISSEQDGQSDHIKNLISEQTDHEIALLYAYNGYCKYRNSVREHSSDQKDEQHSVSELYEMMYASLPEHMIHKFKYDSGSFLY